MENNNLNNSDPEDPGSQQTKSVNEVPHQNKYPVFDMNGMNYNTPSVIPSSNLPPSPLSEPQILNEGAIITESVKNTNNTLYASIKRRSMASFIDGLIIGTISTIISLPVYISQMKNIIAVYNTTNPQFDKSMLDVKNPLYTILTLLSLLIGFIYPVYFIAKGATPGKKLMKIHVVDATGNKAPGFGKAFLREIIGKFASSIFLFLGYIWAFWDKDKQTWHDKIAGTLVVKKIN